MRRLKVAVADHNGKALSFVRALALGGHALTAEPPADLFLIDADPPRIGHRPIIDKHKSAGATVVLYPHAGGGARAILQYDGLWEPYEGVDVALVTAVGQAEVLRRLEYPKPTYAIGWTYCEQRPFTPRDRIRHVVFAPTHPNADGSMDKTWREDNANVFRRLLEGPWRVTVRHIGTLAENGLWEQDGVTYVNGRLSAQLTEIDAADAVVASEGTFPTLAIARGVPTVSYAHEFPMGLGLPGVAPVKRRREALYGDYIRYPFDVADGPLDEVLHAAARSDEPIAEWRRRFIGPQMNPRDVLGILERAALDPRPAVRLDPTRRFATVAFADELVERPELLRTYAGTFTAADDATLIVYAPGLDGNGLLALAERAVEAAGIDGDALPDVLLPALAGSPEADQALAERASAVLSEWPPVGALGRLPRFGAGDGDALRAAAG